MGAGVFLAKLFVFFSSGDFGGGSCPALGWVKAGFPKCLGSAVLKQPWPIWSSTGPGESPLAPSAAWWWPPCSPCLSSVPCAPQHPLRLQCPGDLVMLAPCEAPCPAPGIAVPVGHSAHGKSCSCPLGRSMSLEQLFAALGLLPEELDLFRCTRTGWGNAHE